VLGLCVAGAGCQSSLGPHVNPADRVALPPAAALSPTTPGVAARGGEGQTVVTVWRAAAPAEEAHGTTVRCGWHKAARPDGSSPAVVQSAEYQGPLTPGEATSTTPFPVVPDVHLQMPSGDFAPPKDHGDEGLPLPRPAGGPVPLHAGVPLAHPVPHFPGGPPGAGLPHELYKKALPPYKIEPPDILLVEAFTPKGKGPAPLEYEQPIRGQHLVRPDGTISLGIHGQVFVGGMTVDEAKSAIFNYLRSTGRFNTLELNDLNVDVLAYNSKFYYVVTDGGGYGEQIYPFLITGSETVLDALAKINGLPPVSDKRKVWVARRGPGDVGEILPVDYVGLVRRGGTATNYQLLPGDRVYVKADCWITGDTWLAKRLQPIERAFGAVLLGSETVNSIRNKSATGGTTP
jgi:polysaccharide export outer membrane protein